MPVGRAFATKAMRPEFVAKHSWTPLLHYIKTIKRYKSDVKKTKDKERPIMYASHKDACILSYYAFLLNGKLESYYNTHSLNENIIAYRALGKANYDFSADIHHYAVASAPVAILAFDVKGFFDNLDHKLLKQRLKNILNVTSLSTDWLKVYNSITRFHYVKMSDIVEKERFSVRIKDKSARYIATIAELKSEGVKFSSNPKRHSGIPQGTPISAAMSNLYMIDFDLAIKAQTTKIGALYRRYSDDILIVCKEKDASLIESIAIKLLTENRLEISKEKTERTLFDPSCRTLIGSRSAQYLGFTFYPGGSGIRPSSMSRQWRKMCRAIARTERIGDKQVSLGLAQKIYLKRLVKRFTPIHDAGRDVALRNFSSYAKRSALVFGKGEKITRQSRRIERAFRIQLLRLKDKY